jgi:hypothetical protein
MSRKSNIVRVTINNNWKITASHSNKIQQERWTRIQETCLWMDKKIGDFVVTRSYLVDRKTNTEGGTSFLFGL